VVDFQTVNLGQDFLLGGWTTWGKMEGRKGGPAKTGTHIRLRHYLADAAYFVALTLHPTEEAPTLSDVMAALYEPARPLFLGRKSCLPAAPLAVDQVRSSSLVDALRGQSALRPVDDDPADATAWWPAEDGEEGDGPSRLLPVTDHRDWSNQIHVGRRFIREGALKWEGNIS